VETHATENRARETIAARAVDRILAEHAEQRESDRARQFPEHAKIECRQKEAGIDWNENGDRDQETEQQFKRRAGIFERLAVDFAIGP